MSIARSQRHTKQNPCEVCGGGENDPRGQERRCFGWTTEDGDWCHCTRDELAGAIDVGPDGCYSHRLYGPCRCGTQHGEAKSESRPRPPPPRSSDGDIEATYDYHDATGKLRFQVVRKRGKRFLQRAPDGAGGWVWSIAGVERVPYRLPELLAAPPGEPVYVVEGEKDVHSLVALGKLATCNPGGAGKWPLVAAVAADALRGRKVIVVADADEPGRAHAAQVKSLLPESDVAIVEPPSPHKDVTDYLAAGGKLEALTAPRIPERWNIVDVTALATPLPPIPWLCEPLRLAPGAVTLVAGYGYSRKTMALQSLGLSVAAGRTVWGLWSCRRGPFVHLDYEQGRRLTQERYQRLARGMGFELGDLSADALRVGVMPRAYLDDASVADEIVRIVEGAAFVLVDSLRAAFPHADENSSEVRAHLDMLTRVSERTGATIAVIHHARKPSAQNGGTETHSIRGSGALFDACQGVFIFEGEKGQPTKVHHQKERVTGAELETFALDSEDIPLGANPRWGLRVVHKDAEQLAQMTETPLDATKRAIVREIERSKRPFSSANQIYARVKGTRTVCLAALKELTEDGDVMVRDGVFCVVPKVA